MYCQIAYMYMFFLHTHAYNHVHVHVHVLTRNFSASGAKVGVAVAPTTFLNYRGVFCLSQVQDVKKEKTCKRSENALRDFNRFFLVWIYNCSKVLWYSQHMERLWVKLSGRRNFHGLELDLMVCIATIAKQVRSRELLEVAVKLSFPNLTLAYILMFCSAIKVILLSI